MSFFVILFIGLTFLLFGFNIVRTLFGPHWMRSQLRSHFREMQELSQELQAQASRQQPPTHADQSLAANCPTCGAPATDRREVSPNGDIKCSHCGRWFNLAKAQDSNSTRESRPVHGSRHNRPADRRSDQPHCLSSLNPRPSPPHD